MGFLPLAFANPLILLALGLLPGIWWLLRLTPPRPQSEPFPPFILLEKLVKREETPAKSPWWLTLLRLLMAALVILAMAGPVYNPREAVLKGEGPVLVVIDNGWASAPDWQNRIDTALTLVREAADASRPVILVTTAGKREAAKAVDPLEAMARLEAMQPQPLESDHATAAQEVAAVRQTALPGSAWFLSDGLARPGSEELGRVITGAQEPGNLFMPSGSGPLALSAVRNEPDAMTGELSRAISDQPLDVEIAAEDANGLVLARQRLAFAAGEAKIEFRLTEPVELRNQVIRVQATTFESAGAVQLLDDSFRRRVVGLISGESSDLSQPLLSPLHYISRALSPFADLRDPADANVESAVGSLLDARVSAIVMADVGNIPQDVTYRLQKWIEAGGMLVRFAGPRMASNADALLPVQLREGDRNLAGALSWDEPKALAAFEASSPFAGLEPPREVTVSRQVLALQEINLQEKTWATLEDGTPLVTAAKTGAGWLVLFHTSSDASWSNLAISGTFVEMLRRVVNQSRSSSLATAQASVSLPPYRMLDGAGKWTTPGLDARPAEVAAGKVPAASVDNPPGLYGSQDGFSAINLFSGPVTLTPLDPALIAPQAQVARYLAQASFNLKPAMLTAAALLLLLDCLAVLWIGGALGGPLAGVFGRRRAAAAAIVLLAAMAIFVPGTAQAQTATGAADPDFSASLITRIAYVKTGDAQIDETSRAGLSGLTRFLANRTALEPGEPVGIDVGSDELAFFPLIYWPIDAQSPIPDKAAMSRVDAFMKRGGTVLFDTRDQATGPLGGTSGSPEALALQAILASLDIPPLETVPTDHVLTKSFYLLEQFPGRYNGGDLWVERLRGEENTANRPARGGDGVSSILITSNDFAGAWAVDDAFQPMFATVPPDPAQREFAFRAGVNIMMYVLTGNYKADQVHIPALLERLGQ